MTSPYTTVKETHFYLDTTIPYALLRAIDARAQTLFQRIEQGDPVHVSGRGKSAYSTGN